MRYRLKAWEPRKQETDFGTSGAVAFIPYREGAPIWAERAKLTGNGVTEAGEHFADYRADYNIRIFHKIGEGWQVQEVGDKVKYVVRSVIDNHRAGMRTLHCERLND